jgi:hypothetical protein
MVEDKLVEPPQTKYLRCWFRFSLRTILIVFAIIAALLHWIIPSERQRRACEEITVGGGSFDFSGFEFPGREHGLYPKAANIKWYHHYLYHVDRVALRRNPEIDWNVFPKLKTFDVYCNGNVEEILKSNQIPERIVQMTIDSKKAMNSGVIDSLLRYKNLEGLRISTEIDIRDEDKLRSLLELSKLTKLSISKLVILKPQHASLETTFNILNQIKAGRPDFVIDASYFRTEK